MKLEILHFFFCLTLTVNVVAQPAKDVDSYLREAKKNKNLAVPKSIVDPNNAEAVVASLKSYLNDTSDFVKSKSLQLLALAGKGAVKLSVRRQVVEEIVFKWRTYNHRELIAHLKKFHREDFDARAEDSLVHFLELPSTQKSSLIRLVGFVGNEKAVSSLRKFSSAENPQPIRWSALLAMSRIGDAESTMDVLQRVKKLKVNDETVGQLFPDLIYTRQKQTIDYLVEVVQSEEQSCHSADNDNPASILCGYRVMEQLAPVIKNYPLTLDASGDVKTKDYKQSLETVRQWFQNNKDYTIERNTF